MPAKQTSHCFCYTSATLASRGASRGRTAVLHPISGQSLSQEPQ